jgi:hypothetical protein
MASPAHHLTINTLPSEAHNLAVVVLLCAYACWVLRAVVRFYHSWRIRTKCLPQDRVVLVEGLGHRVEASRKGGSRVVCRVTLRGGGLRRTLSRGGVCHISSTSLTRQGCTTPTYLSPVSPLPSDAPPNTHRPLPVSPKHTSTPSSILARFLFLTR